MPRLMGMWRSNGAAVSTVEYPPIESVREEDVLTERYSLLRPGQAVVTSGRHRLPFPRAYADPCSPPGTRHPYVVSPKRYAYALHRIETRV